jgi:hypothetical protein
MLRLLMIDAASISGNAIVAIISSGISWAKLRTLSTSPRLIHVISKLNENQEPNQPPVSMPVKCPISKHHRPPGMAHLNRSPRMKRAAKIIIIRVAVLAAAFVGLVLFVLRATPMESAKHLAHVDWLPIEASDVTYARRGGFGWFTCYECSLPKEALDRMAQKEGWKMEPKSDVHTGLRVILGLPALKDTEYGGIDSVAKAMFHEKRQSNGGGVTVIYDLDAGRLFVHETHR